MEQIKLEATNEQTSPDRLSQLAKINSTLASLVANNPNATPELLRKLADREEDFIRKNVAANPNTPMEVFWKLGEEFPQEVLENAVFPLLLLENPNLLEEIPRETIASFLKCSAVPISFMEWAIALEWTQELCLELARNSQTPHAVLEVLVRSQNKAVAVEAQLMVNYAGEIQEDWQGELRRLTNRINVFSGERLDRWQEIGDSYFFHILAAIGLVPEFVFESLARQEVIEFRCLVASIPSLPLHLLEKLGRDREDLVRATVGQNPSASPEMLKLLAVDETIEVRTAVAENPNAPAYLLEELIEAVSQKPGFSTLAPEVLLAVASNSNTPKAILEKLERSQLKDDPKLKISLAANPNTPVDILEQLEREEGDAVGDRLASNPSTPKHLLEKFARSKREQTRELLASNPQLPESAIHLLVEDKNSYVRKAIAANELAPLETALQLWRDSKFYKLPSGAAANDLEKGFVKFILSDSQNVFNSFVSLAQDKLSRKQLSDFFADFTKATKKIVSRYLKEKPEGLSVLLELIIAKTKADSRELVRTIALWHPQMPAKVLAENRRSLLWLERCAIAQNSNTPIETLQLLAADGNRIIRAAAKDNLERILNTSI